MNRIFMTFLVVFFISMTSGAEEKRKADHDQLRELRRVFEAAASANDLDRIRPYLADDFSIVTFTDREFHDFDAFKSRWKMTRDEMLKGGAYTIDLNPELSTFVGDIAICRGDAKNILTTGSGDKYSFTSKWTVVCQKKDGQWKILRGHNSLDPFGNPMLVANVKKIVLWSVAGALLAGLVLGFTCSWLLGRRRKTA